MRVLLKMVLDCEPDAAWRAIRSPEVFTAVSGPFTTFTSLEDEGFPDVWPTGDHPVEVRAFGLVPIGDQVISISYPPTRKGVRMVRDTGAGVSGPLAFVTEWEHSMAVSPAAGGRTLYRDQLVFRAEPATLLLWPLYWVFWQWRAVGIRRLSAGWRA
jgi:hypothetical protein